MACAAHSELLTCASNNLQTRKLIAFLQDGGDLSKDLAPRGPFSMLDTEKLSQKLMELRAVLLEGADYRPIEILDELSAMYVAVRPIDMAISPLTLNQPGF